MRLGGHLDNGEWKRVGDLEGTVDVHADDGTSSGGWKTLRGMFDDFHYHLEHLV